MSTESRCTALRTDGRACFGRIASKYREEALCATHGLMAARPKRSQPPQQRRTVTLDAHTDFWWLLVGFVRYAMGRRSTAPSLAVDLVLQHRDALHPTQVTQIADEVERELVLEAQHPGTLGDACDVRDWRELVRKLREPTTGAGTADRSTYASGRGTDGDKEEAARAQASR